MCCMEDINFSFIGDSVFRRNVQRVFRDVFGLIALLSDDVSPSVVSCLRKTVVLYTASIIEALVLWKIRQEVVAEKVTLKNEWKYLDPKLIHTTDAYEIIWAKRKEEERSISNLDFNVMIRICRDKNIFGDALLLDLDKVRKLRNEIHTDRLENVVKTYRMVNVEFVQKVLIETVRAIR